MKNYETLELQAKAMRLVEGTEFGWMAAIRLDNKTIYDGSYELCRYSAGELELALAIVENRPVFAGDELYLHSEFTFYPVEFEEPSFLLDEEGTGWNLSKLSWNAPKPKTVMVELLVEDAEYYVGDHFETKRNVRVSDACRKALGELK